MISQEDVINQLNELEKRFGCSPLIRPFLYDGAKIYVLYNHKLYRTLIEHTYHSGFTVLIETKTTVLYGYEDHRESWWLENELKEDEEKIKHLKDS